MSMYGERIEEGCTDGWVREPLFRAALLSHCSAPCSPAAPPSALLCLAPRAAPTARPCSALTLRGAPEQVNLSRMESGVYILSLSADANPENRWILPFNQAIMKAFDALEWHLEHEAGDLPAALLTVSESPKFFSNGIDPTGAYGKQIGLEPPSEVDQLEGIILGMPGFIRPLQLPIPTIAAVSNAALSLLEPYL